MVKKQIASGLGLALVIFAGTAAAQLRPQYQFPEVVRDPSGPAAVQLGSSPVYMTPTASVQAGHDSNVTLAKGSTRDSPVQIWGANAVLDAQSSRSVYLGDLYVNRGVYSNSSQDDYSDWGTRNSYDIELTPRNYFHANWDYIQGHEGRGTTDRPELAGPDVYRLNTQGAIYAYGAPGAQGRIEVYGSHATRRYTDNRDVTQFSDRNVSEGGAVFYWRAMPKTYALIEGRETRIRYLLPGRRLSGDEDRIFVGATWEATAATSGTVKIGEFQKKFDNDGIPSYRAPAWEAEVNWSPRSYTNFGFFTVKTPTESTGLGNFVIAEIAGVVWNHTWNQRVNTSLSVQYQRSIYQGFDRSDDGTLVDFKANYQMRRWLTLGAEYIYSNRNSTFDLADYNRNIWLLSANISM